ncbi:MAG: hypothetical protein ABEH77_03545 [Halobacteriaceae archaeon]
MAEHTSTRRGLLRLGGTAGLAGAAGCLRLRDAATSVDPPEPGPPAYRRWLPAPAGLPGEEPSYMPTAVRVADLRGGGAVARAGVSVRNLWARTFRDPIGIAGGAVQSAVKVDLATTLLRGGFDTAALDRGARAVGYRAVDTHRGFRLYERGGRRWGLAVAADAVLFSARDDPLAHVRAVADAGRGATPRYHERDATVGRLSRAAGGPSFVWLQPTREDTDVASAVGAARTQQFTADRVFFTNYVLFASSAAADPAALRESVSGGSVDPLSTNPLDVAVDGRVGRVEFSMRVAEVAEFGHGELLPIVAWAFEYDPAAGTVTVTHRGGDPVPADRLTLEAPEEPTDRQFADGTVAPGDSVRVSVAPGTTVRVVWSVEDTTSTLDSYEVPAE